MKGGRSFSRAAGGFASDAVRRSLSRRVRSCICAALLIVTGLLGFSPAARAGGFVIAWGSDFSGETDVPSNLGSVPAIGAGGDDSLALEPDGTVATWGANYNGELNVPAGLNNVTAIAAGAEHEVALRSDGTVVAWGYFTTTNVPAGLSNVTAIAAGGYHTLALKGDGTVVDWPNNDVPAGISDVMAIAAGDNHNLVLSSNGTVIGWGDNTYGQTNVPAGLSNVTAIAAGYSHSLALKSDGTVVAWGANYYGQTNIPAGLSNVIAIGAGELHSMALKSDGTVVMWGYNQENQTFSPWGLTNVTAIAPGGYHNLVLNDGTPCLVQWPTNQSTLSGMSVVFTNVAKGPPPLAYQWQFNGSGIPGATNSLLVLTNVQPSDAGNYAVVVTNLHGSVTSPAAALVVNTSAPAITQQPVGKVTWLGGTAGFSLSVAGSLPFTYQWRLNGTNVSATTVWAATNSLILTNVQMSQFGAYDAVISNPYGSLTSSVATLSFSQVALWGSPSNLPPGLTNVVAVVGYPAVLRSDGRVASWANTVSPILFTVNGLSNIVAIVGPLGLTAGEALLTNGNARLWNLENSLNLPGSGSSNVVAVAGDNYANLELKPNGTVAGSATNGLPLPVLRSLTNIVAIAEGFDHSLALKATGTVVAWGNNFDGQLNVPVGLSNVVAIAAGGYHNLALKSDGTVVAWGRNVEHQTNVPSGLNNVAAIAAGSYHSMALRTDGTVVAWGSTNYGLANVPAGLSNVVAIAAGDNDCVALIGDGPPVMRVSLANPAAGPNTFSLTLPTQNGRVYALEYRTNLTDGNWTALPLNFGTGTNLVLTDSTATNSQRVYRVRRW
jgi:alpha-tubulin suppressor-like RCC1 family protein